MFGTVKLTKNVDPDKYKYPGYGIGFEMSRTFSLSDGGKYCKNTIAFIADMSSSGQIDNRKK